MPRRDGKAKFFKYLLDDELITEDEFKFLLKYIREIREQLDKEV